MSQGDVVVVVTTHGDNLNNSNFIPNNSSCHFSGISKLLRWARTCAQCKIPIPGPPTPKEKLIHLSSAKLGTRVRWFERQRDHQPHPRARQPEESMPVIISSFSPFSCLLLCSPIHSEVPPPSFLWPATLSRPCHGTASIRPCHFDLVQAEEAGRLSSASYQACLSILLRKSFRTSISPVVVLTRTPKG